MSAAPASRRIFSISARIQSASRFWSSAASEPIFVPSMAIWPSEARPAAQQSLSTSVKRPLIAASFSARKRAIVRWSGQRLAAITL